VHRWCCRRRKRLLTETRVRDLAPGETREISVDLPERWLALWSDEANARVVQPGELTISAGPASDNLQVVAKIAV
jgi:hypothetical protein